MAGADFIVNVTLNHEFQLTGVFAGDLVAAAGRSPRPLAVCANLHLHPGTTSPGVERLMLGGGLARRPTVP